MTKLQEEVACRYKELVRREQVPFQPLSDSKDVKT